jgi:hypothetical protein
VSPESSEAARICREDLNEVITAFVQDKPTLERGLFDRENTLAEELTQLQMGKIVRDRYPELSETDQEAIRQHAVAAMNLAQEAKQLAAGDGKDDGQARANTSLIDGIRKIAMDVRELDIDLIDRINPFDAAYAVLSKAMDERTLKQVQAAISAKKVNIPYDDARDLAVRAVKFKQERGRSPDITSTDAWEKRLAEGVIALARHRAQRQAIDV